MSPARCNLSLKAYRAFAAQNRPEGWTGWVTLAISPRRTHAATVARADVRQND